MKTRVNLFLLLIIKSLLLFNCNGISKKDTFPILDETDLYDSIKTSGTIILDSYNENLKEIIQKSIDLPKLQQYYHSEIPNRSPLVIIKNNQITLTSIHNIHKFDAKVQILDKSNIEENKMAYLLFSKISINQDSAFVQFSYPIEGIKVKIEFIKNGEEWLIKRSDLIEN